MGKEEGLIVFFGAENLAKVHHFYQGILGFPLYKDQGACRIYDVPGSGKLGFCNHIEPTKAWKSPIITWVVEDVDRIYQKLVDSGWNTLEPPKVNEAFKIYHFFIKDPNGYALEIQKFLD